MVRPSPSPYPYQSLTAVVCCRLHSRRVQQQDTVHAALAPREIVDLSRNPPPPSPRRVPRARSRQFGHLGTRLVRGGDQERGWVDGMGRRGTRGCYRLGGTQGQFQLPFDAE
jgi:hypothetical protein